MRQIISYIAIAAVAGFVGASFSKAPELVSKVNARLNSPPAEPAGFWTTPAIAGYGKIHYEQNVAYKPDVQDSNKIVFQITKSENNMRDPNLGLERVARVVNLYIASGVPAEKLKFVVSVTGDGTPAMLDNSHYHAAYGIDNPNLKLISELRDKGVDVSVCDQSVAFHHYQYNWIDKSVTHALSSPTTVSTLQNQGYAYLQM
ncbi:sulfur reduction protein DsrE [Erwinia sp. OLTSP20]|uniref:DsrE family protein n=1 Tax=unclassified Erwinia TaxID=2622719 RepID=UPI000C18C199|nr:MULTISPECIES: DsrE family protein [unclassified Erwinia]PIJ51594.1 sulfur reduction protein DsrE [Erwinia sp. OAMSP11]PIJ68914.1 sulfur reduction protein DsrE [Erwinia sp. OLSSP12]PIJ83504.1 sulfur reduction protein DsrE [Erwinia sp. OLCASP19]PIJ83572.1 sulfur reduction protein DsrE [Erwinia sp. OLMDSP33]PIJ86337.1 sulfur reduction protein DsrE [Erwinia sp. OLMTSP26]